MERCEWAKTTDNMLQYHDAVWGVPIYDDQQLYRKLILDINQAGLSWQTILNKADAFDAAYDAFDLEKIAAYDDQKREELMNNAGIIRNKRKIDAAIVNAQAVIAMQKSGESFSDFLWSFTNHEVVVGRYHSAADIPAKTALSDAITKELKKRGFKFVGSTIIYAFLQAVGIVNDHVTSCFRYKELVGDDV